MDPSNGGATGGQTYGAGAEQGGATDRAFAGSSARGTEYELAGRAGASATTPCNGTCASPTPACNLSTNRCVECLMDEHCGASSPVCSDSGNCVECTATEHCQGAKAVCKVDSNRCVECESNADCAATIDQLVCDSANQCVGCLQNSDCQGFRSSPSCLVAKKICVGCLENTDCTNVAAPYCDPVTNSCAPCGDDLDCAHIQGKNVCAAGVCVQCTTINDKACATAEGVERSCDPRTNSCTQTRKSSVRACGACVADSECQSDGVTARCVPMTFGPNHVPRGSYCLPIASGGCEQPFGSTLVMTVTAVSASGAPSAEYCGIDQGLVTCEAIRDMQDPSNSIRCTNPNTNLPDDGLCGCPRNPITGGCEGPGEGGLCREINGANRCTIRCGDGSQCTTGRGCTSKSPPYCG